MISTMTGVIVPQFPLSRETGVHDDEQSVRYTGNPQGWTDSVLQLSACGRRGKGNHQIIIKKTWSQDRGDHLRELLLWKDLSSIFIEEFKKLGGTILAEEVIEKGGRDFRSN